MSYWLEPELQRYFGMAAVEHPPPPFLAQQTELRSVALTAISEDPTLAFMLRLDSVLSVRGGVVTCLATVRRNVHHYDLVYMQRYKQIAEPDIRHPRSKEQVLLCLDPKTLRCGQQVLIKVHTRQEPTEPLQLLRECSILRASSDRDPAVFPKAYLFGCLGNNRWRVASSDRSDERRLEMHKQHFLLCQYVEDSLQRVMDANRSSGQCMETVAAARLGRDMLNRLAHLHSLGWAHGDLRPACFLLGGDELLLGDFASASPLAMDCLTRPTPSLDDHDGPSLAAAAADASIDSSGVAYRSARFVADAVFADVESLVYILCGLISPSPLPWEAEGPATDRRQCKLAVWQFVEAADEDGGNSLWEEWRLGSLFNCSREEVGQHPAYRLALAVSRQRCASGTDERVGGLPADYGALLASLLRVEQSRV